MLHSNLRQQRMKIQKDYRPLACGECAGGAGLEFEFTMAFQPMVRKSTREIFAHEALVRGPNNEPAGKIFEHVNDTNRYRFDQSCRVKAIQLGAELGIEQLLSINFMPNAVYRPELCIRTSMAAAETYGFPIERIILEITEAEKALDTAHLREIVEHYRERGFMTAIDDFGAGYSGLNLLAEFQTDFIKLDMAMVRNIDRDRIRQAIVKGVVQVCGEIGSVPIAEGIESYEELTALESLGIDLFQGYHFAKPSFRSLATVSPSAFEPG